MEDILDNYENIYNKGLSQIKKIFQSENITFIFIVICYFYFKKMFIGVNLDGRCYQYYYYSFLYFWSLNAFV